MGGGSIRRTLSHQTEITTITINKSNEIAHLRLTYGANYVHFLNNKTDGGFVAFRFNVFLIISIGCT